VKVQPDSLHTKDVSERQLFDPNLQRRMRPEGHFRGRARREKKVVLIEPATDILNGRRPLCIAYNVRVGAVKSERNVPRRKQPFAKEIVMGKSKDKGKKEKKKPKKS
jgi:hypothetical protein